jgi:hypothetical protein
MKLKKKKKSDEKALQNLIKMQAKGLAAAQNSKSKMKKLAKEQKEIAQKALIEKEMFEEKHKEALIEKENIAKQLEKQQRHAAELQEDHQLEIDLRERRLREAKVAEEEARTLAEKARLEGMRKEEEMEAKEGKWLVGLVGLW